jgi:hypothetical protein
MMMPITQARDASGKEEEAQHPAAAAAAASSSRWEGFFPSLSLPFLQSPSLSTSTTTHRRGFRNILVVVLFLAIHGILFRYNETDVQSTVLNDVHHHHHHHQALLFTTQENTTTTTIISSTGSLEDVINTNTTTTTTSSTTSFVFEPKDFTSIITEAFLQQCVATNTARLKQKAIPNAKAPAMKLYKLGDCIIMCHCYDPEICGNITPCNHKTIPNKNPKLKKRPFPADSISELYMEQACPRAQNYYNKTHLEIVERIFDEKRGAPGFDRIPNRTAFVIQLRLGDVISGKHTPTNVLSLLLHGGTATKGRFGVPRYFPSVFEYLQEIHNATHYHGYKSVELIGGSHMGGKAAMKGMIYGKCLEESIAKAGYSVLGQTSQGYGPDEHFFYASHASRILIADGGYASLIGILAKRRGGQVLGPTHSMLLQKKQKQLPSPPPVNDTL